MVEQPTDRAPVPRGNRSETATEGLGEARHQSNRRNGGVRLKQQSTEGRRERQRHEAGKDDG